MGARCRPEPREGRLTTTTITVCTTCRQPHLREDKARDPCGEALLAAVEAAAQGVPGVEVRGTACLMGCEHGCNAAISGPGKMTYVLGRFAPGPRPRRRWPNMPACTPKAAPARCRSGNGRRG